MNKKEIKKITTLFDKDNSKQLYMLKECEKKYKDNEPLPTEVLTQKNIASLITLGFSLFNIRNTVNMFKGIVESMESTISVNDDFI